MPKVFLLASLLALCMLARGVEAQAIPAPLYPGYDVFVVAGQSNAKGRGDAPLAPEVLLGGGYESTAQGVVGPLADPVGGAETGSAWPAFANAYSAATGRGVIIIGLATNGSRQVALSGDTPNQHWDVSQEDNLYVRAEAKIRRALLGIEAEVLNYRLAGWLWIQGGTDARRIDEGRMTIDEYEASLHALAQRVSADWNVPLYLAVSGTDARGDTPGFQAVRAVQNEADALEEVVVIYRDAYLFPERGWMQPDNVHWAQPGLNEAGTFGAAVAAEHQLSLPPETAPVPESTPQPAPPIPSAPVPEPTPEPAPEPVDPQNPPDPPDPENPEEPEEPVDPENPEPPPPFELRVYPNPASGAAWVDMPCEFRYVVSDVLGRRMAKGRGTGRTALPLLGAGLYIVRITPRGDEPACRGVRTLTIAP